MSLLQSCTMWFRANFGWSSSRQSWQERLSLGGILLAAFMALWLGSRLPLVQQLFLWGLIVVAALVLLRRGWLQLFGRVLFYDMVRAARRSRYFFLRWLYAA